MAKDLKSIKDFITEDNADKALETVQAIYRQFENIQQFPLHCCGLVQACGFSDGL